MSGRRALKTAGRGALLFLALLALLPSTAAAHPSWAIVRDEARGLVYYSDLRQVFVVNAKLQRRVAVPGVHTHELYLDASGRLFGEDAKVNGRHRIWRLDPDGRLVDIIPDTAGYRDDWGFVADGGGNLYWAKCTNPGPPRDPFCEVRRRTPEGRLERAAGGQRFAHPLNFLAPALDGSILLADGPNVMRLRGLGAPEVVAKDVTRAKDRFAFMGFHQLKDGALVVAAFGDREVIRIEPSGARRVLARSTGSWAPTGALQSTDGLWVLEFEGAQARLRFVDSRGGERVFPPSP